MSKVAQRQDNPIGVMMVTIAIGFFISMFVGFGICTNVANRLGSTTEDPSCGTHLVSLYSFIPVFVALLVGLAIVNVQRNKNHRHKAVISMLLCSLAIGLAGFYVVTVARHDYLEWVSISFLS